MFLLAVWACRAPPPEPEPPLDRAEVSDQTGILAARHAFDDRIELPAPVDALVASRDGSRFAARLDDGAVHVFDAAGTTRFLVRGSAGAARVLAWSDDGSRLAIGGTERITVIDAEGQRVAGWAVSELHDAVLSPRGASLVASTGTDVTWYDAATGDVRWTRPHGGGPIAFLREHEAVAVSDGAVLRRIDRLGGLQAEVDQPGIVELHASEDWLRTLDGIGRSAVLATSDLRPPADPTPWPRRIQSLAPGPRDHWFIDGEVFTSALADESDGAFVTRDSRLAAFVRVHGDLALWVAEGSELRRWSLWRAPRVTALPVLGDVSELTFLGTVPRGPFVLGSDDGRLWAVPVDDVDRIAWSRTLPRCPRHDDLGCMVLDVGGTAERLEVATDEAAYLVRTDRQEAQRIARLRGLRGAIAMPDGRWLSWGRDSVRVGGRAGAGRRVGPPLDVPRVAVGDVHHAVVWDSALVVRDTRGRPHGERWPIPYDELPSAVAVSPDGNVIAAAVGDRVRLFFVESGFAQLVRPEVQGVHGLEFTADGQTLWAAGEGLTRIVVNQAQAVERWSLAGGPRVERSASHPDLDRVAGLQQGPDGPRVLLLPPR